jgi:hypothetical protein
LHKIIKISSFILSVFIRQSHKRRLYFRCRKIIKS